MSVFLYAKHTSYLLSLCTCSSLQVEFSISEVKRTGQQSAVSVRLLNRTASKKVYGFVATLKDNFGFIETANHDQEIFFHYR